MLNVFIKNTKNIRGWTEGRIVYNVYVYLVTTIVNLAAILINGFILSAAITFFIGFVPRETLTSLTNKLFAYIHISYRFAPGLKSETDLALYWAAIIMIFFIILSLTPFADFVLRKCYGFGKPLKDERERFYRLFSKVCERANKNPSDYKLYVTDDPCLNACALGFNNIAITRSLLIKGSDNDIKSVLAHEMGHIQYNDCSFLRVFVTVSIIGQAALWSIKIFAAIVGGLSRIPIPFFNLFTAILSSISWIWIFILDILLVLPLSIAAAFGSRRQEYRADEYACSLGYGNDLYNFIYKLLDSDYRPPKGLSVIWRTHPNPRNRLNKIESYLEKQKGNNSQAVPVN